jgi:hypothetical protein
MHRTPGAMKSSYVCCRLARALGRIADIISLPQAECTCGGRSVPAAGLHRRLVPGQQPNLLRRTERPPTKPVRSGLLRHDPIVAYQRAQRVDRHPDRSILAPGGLHPVNRWSHPTLTPRETRPAAGDATHGPRSQRVGHDRALRPHPSRRVGPYTIKLGPAVPGGFSCQPRRAIQEYRGLPRRLEDPAP